jgi:hypothetical protein
MSSSTPFRVLVPLALVVLGACDPQVGENYKGEPLASMHGVVVNELDRSIGPLDASLVWLNSSSEPDTTIGDSEPVSGDFPAGFRLDVYRPPDEAALNDYTNGGEYPDESRIGVAWITALREGQTLTGAESEPYGIAEGHLLLYLESDVRPGTASEELVGEPLEAGFHLMDVVDQDDPACSRDGLDCLQEAGFDSEIEIRIDEVEQLDIPNWS